MIDAATIDLVIVPLVCVDKSGHRVGYGKGFYDRFLKQVRTDCVKVGLSYFEPVERIDDVHEGDVRLDFVITPK
jgi:5-formyltetrahydrofolate cyclo-ligase